jgi:NAD(P)-dependent dehydrogenase (short-subunit alcohol dehydrogenase family)
VALRLAADGHAVVLMGRRADRLESIAAEIRAGGGQALATAGDVGIHADADRAIGEALGAFGGLDVLVNNAGTTTPARRVSEISPEEWNDVVRTNLTGVFLLTRAALPSLIERRGSVITVGSVFSALVGRANAAYCATKAAVLMFTQCVAVDHGPQGVRANCVLPGWIRTDMADDAVAGLVAEHGLTREEAYTLATSNIPARRAAVPEEVAEVVSFLAGPGASYINGAALPVDGGSLAVWAGAKEFVTQPVGVSEAAR